MYCPTIAHAVTAGAVGWAILDSILNRMKTAKTINGLKDLLAKNNIPVPTP